MRFPTVKKFWKSVKIWQSYREFKSGNFFETQCIHVFCSRPPAILLSTDLGFTAILSSSSSSIFFRQLPSELAVQNSTKTGHMLGIECDLKKMYVRNLWYTLPYKVGPQNHLFRRLLNLTATLTRSLIHLKSPRTLVWHKLTQLGKCARSYKTSPTSSISKAHEFWFANGLKLERPFYPFYVNSAFYL